MVDVLDRVGLPTRISDLLLTFAGRVDDDSLIEAREFLAVAELGRAVELLLGTVAAGPVPITAAERDELARLADRLLLDERMLDRLALTERVNVVHRFTSGSVGDPSPEEGVLQALSSALRVLPDVRGLWCVWRTTPAGAVPGPVPQRVVLIEVGSGGFAPSTAYRSENALRGAGISAVVEVLRSGGVVPSYHDEALAAARAIPLGNTLPARGNEPGQRTLGRGAGYGARHTSPAATPAVAGGSAAGAQPGGSAWTAEKSGRASDSAGDDGVAELNSRYGPEPTYTPVSSYTENKDEQPVRPAFSATATPAASQTQSSTQSSTAKPSVLASPAETAPPEGGDATESGGSEKSASASSGTSTVTELHAGASPVSESAKPTESIPVGSPTGSGPTGFAPPSEDAKLTSVDAGSQSTPPVTAESGFSTAPSSAEPTQRQEAPGAGTSTSSGWRVARPETDASAASGKGNSSESPSSSASTSDPSSYQPTIPDEAGLNQRELGLLRQLHEELSRREQADRDSGSATTGEQPGGASRPPEMPAPGGTSWMPAPGQRPSFNNVNGSQRNPGSTY